MDERFDIEQEPLLDGTHSTDLSISEEEFYSFVKTKEAPKPFQSRFKSWIRTVALIVVMVFVPEQLSWAFNYNPLVLWGDKGARVTEQGASGVTVDSTATADEIVSARIAASVNHLLDKIANKEKTRIQLQLTGQGSRGKGHDLFIDSDTMFTRDRIRQISDWLKDPNIHPLNCGVYVMKDVLASQDVNVPLEELSVASLMVDIMGDIVKPGEEKLKTSLFAINKVIDAYGLKFQPAKVDPADALKLKTPFIANFDSEHFVTVNSVDDTLVHYTDIGRVMTMPKDAFVEQLSGYVMASLNAVPLVDYEIVPPSVQAFIWGNKWVDRSDDLPGLMSGGEIALSAAISIAGAALGAGSLMAFAFSLAMSSFANTMATVCVMKGSCSEQQGMMLSMAISVGASFGAGMGGDLGATLDTGNVYGNIAVGMAVGTAQGYLKYEKNSGKFESKRFVLNPLGQCQSPAWGFEKNKKRGHQKPAEQNPTVKKPVQPKNPFPA